MLSRQDPCSSASAQHFSSNTWQSFIYTLPAFQSCLAFYLWLSSLEDMAYSVLVRLLKSLCPSATSAMQTHETSPIHHSLSCHLGSVSHNCSWTTYLGFGRLDHGDHNADSLFTRQFTRFKRRDAIRTCYRLWFYIFPVYVTSLTVSSSLSVQDDRARRSHTLITKQHVTWSGFV